MSGRHYVRALAGVTLAAALIRLTGLGESVWFDEWYVLGYSDRSPSDAMRALSQSDMSPPLFFLAEQAWLKLVGVDETAARVLAALLLGTAAVPVAAEAARTLSGSRRAALVTAVLMTLAPLAIWYSQEARAYSLVLLVASAQLLFFARTLRGRDAVDVAAWGVCSALLVCTHFVAGIAVAAQGLWLFVAVPELRRHLVAAALGVGVVVVALVPLIVLQPNPDWIDGIDRGQRLEETARHPLFGFIDLPAAVWVAGCAALAAVAVVCQLRARGQERRAAATLWALGLATLALVVLADLRVDVLLSRTVVFAYVVLVVALGCTLAAAGRTGLAAAGALVALWAGVGVASRLDSDLDRPDWRAVGQALGTPEGHRLVVAAGLYKAYPLLSYLPSSRLQALEGEQRVEEIAVVGWERPDDGTGCWAGRGCDMADTPLAGGPPAPGFERAGTERLGRFTVVRWRSERPRVVDVAAVRGSVYEGTSDASLLVDGEGLVRPRWVIPGDPGIGY